MVEKETAIVLMNIIALALKIIDEYDQSKFTEFYALENFSAIESETRDDLDKYWNGDKTLERLIEKLESEINNLTNSTNQSRYVKAYSICVWLDKKFTYSDRKIESGQISLWPLFHITDDMGFEQIGSLNSNFRETHIWINPKLAVRKTYSSVDPRETKRVFNRDAYYGINGDISNYCYFRWDGSCEISNVIISDKVIRDVGNQNLKIAFAPLTCLNDVLDDETVTEELDGIRKASIHLSLKDKYKKPLRERMLRDIRLASLNGAHIVFMPEMLGIEEDLIVDEGGYLEWFYEYSLDQLADGIDAPRIIIWPSLWSDGRNGATITHDDGNVIGVQYKYFPYVDKKKHIREGLRESNTKKYIVIHIPNVHRITVLICSEFLAESQSKWADILNRCLDVSLVIVPSFTPGEQDFLNDISKYIDTDTCVIWGNCCGAALNMDKAVGAVSKIGANSKEIFGENLKCDGVCEEIKSCLFMVDISLAVSVSKHIEKTSIVEHIIEK